MKTVLIIGSTGKIGNYFQKNLQSEYKIYTISRLKTSESNFYYDFDSQVGDLSVLKSINFDCAIHSIGLLPSSKFSENAFYRVNADSLNLIRLYLNDNCKFIMLSTISVYGESIVGRTILESDKVNPKNLYAKSKLQGEIYCRQQFSKHYIFRIPPVFLDFQEKTIYKRIIKTSFIEMKFGSDSQKHSYCSLVTLLKITKFCIDLNINYGIYHIADRKAYSNVLLKKLINKKSVLKINFPKYLFLRLLNLSNILRINNLYSKLNEIYFKLFCDNLYSTNKIYSEINEEHLDN